LTDNAASATLVPGVRLTPLIRRPTRITCFLFAVAWWTPHRVHYDLEWAAHEGYGDVMVPGLLLNEYAVTAVTSWTGDPSTLRRLTVRYTAPAVAGDTLTIEPLVTGVSALNGLRNITFGFEMRRQDGVEVLVGEAVVAVPSADTGVD